MCFLNLFEIVYVIYKDHAAALCEGGLWEEVSSFFGGRNRCGDFQITKREIQVTDVNYDKEMMMYIRLIYH